MSFGLEVILWLCGFTIAGTVYLAYLSYKGRESIKEWLKAVAGLLVIAFICCGEFFMFGALFGVKELNKTRMEKSKNYEQIYVESLKGYDALEGKKVDKVGFYNRNNYDDNIFIITFTDGTYVAIGTDYRDADARDYEPILRDFYVYNPRQFNDGNFQYHSYVDKENGKLHFTSFVKVLTDLGIWEISEEEALRVIEEDAKKEEEREYQQYLRLKEKFKDRE